MRGGALPPALLCAVIGLLLAYAPRRAVFAAIAGLVMVALAVAFLPLPGELEEVAFLGCWISVMASAAAIHLPSGPGPRLAVALGLNAGIWTGAVIAIAGAPLDLAVALPAVLIVLLALWARTTTLGVGVKVVASWLGAVAILAAAVPLTVTPGYQPDHRE